jgi:integrase
MIGNKLGNTNPQQKGICMKGGIYSDQRCPLCGESFRDNRISGMSCPSHQEQRPTRFKVIFDSVTKRFSSYHEAFRFLTGLRYEVDQSKFDPREYMLSSPLGFATLAAKFMELKKKTMRPDGFRSYQSHFRRATEFFDNVPVSRIGFGHIEDFVHSLSLSTYTVKCNLDWVMNFLRWCHRRGDIKSVPEKPAWKWEQEMRNIVDKPTQASIVKKVYEQHGDTKPRACIGIQLLCTYPKIRPDELRQVKEKHIDLKRGYLTIPHPKEGKGPKIVKLTDRDLELLRSLTRGFPEMYFLRHERATGGRAVGSRFGKNLLYQIWQRACSELGIEGVPLYPGTKHSTASDLARKFPSALVQKTTGHTSKAFERYLVLGEEECVSLYEEASPDKALTMKMRGSHTD